jgi:cytidine deaminase
MTRPIPLVGRAALGGVAWLAVLAGCTVPGCRQPESSPAWTLSAESAVRTEDPILLRKIGQALDGAEKAGTDPSISRFHVRAATVITADGQDQVVVGGNTEYTLPEAIHGEVSVVNHVIARFGPEAAREVQFIAFYSQTCGDSRGCGDCRDYMRAATTYTQLMWICGRASDRTIHIRRFADGLIDEEQFPDATADTIALPRADLDRLLEAAVGAQAGGVTLFTPTERQVGAAALTSTGRVYRAAGADDAAFHYRYPVGGVLQQAATERDYFVRAVLVAGAGGEWPRVMYRDRQYGFETSSFATSRGLPATLLILSNGEGALKSTTFEAALPHPFSVARFNPQAIERFLTRTGASPGPVR